LGEVPIIVNFLEDTKITKTLKSTWLYLQPPAPVIDVESVVFADNPGLWVPAGAKGFEGFFVIQNLNSKYGLAYDRLEVKFGRYNGSVVSVREIGVNAHVQVRTPNQMEAAFYIMNVTAFLGEKEVYTVKYGNNGLLVEIEFRDLTDARTVAIAPTEGPVRGGTIIVLGILSYSSLLKAQEISASFTVGANTSAKTIEQPVLGVLSLYDWMERTGDYERFANSPAISSFMLGINADLQNQYNEAVDKTIAAVDQVALNVQQGRKEAVLAFVRTPTLAQAAQAHFSIRHGPHWNVSIKASFLYVAAPLGRAAVSASTEDGLLRSGLSGGTRLTFVLTNFDIVYKANDVKVLFGEKQVDVSRLLYSTQKSTEFFIVVPPNTPQVLNVKVSPVLFPSNWVQFDFEYYDDIVPEVTSYSPYQAYEDGGVEMKVDIILFPQITASEITISIRSGTELVGTVIASKVTYESETATVSFQLPPGPVGEATMSVNAASKATDAVIFNYVAVPRTRPTVLRVWPTIGSSNGGDVMEITLQNFKQVQSINEISMVMMFQVVAFDPEGNEIIETATVTPDKNLMKLRSSALMETRFSITMPRVPEASDTMRPNARIWGARNASLYAECVVDYRDDNLATLLWMIPMSERSDRDAHVEISIAKFGSVKPEDVPGLYFGILSHSGNFSQLDSAFTEPPYTTPPTNETLMTTPAPFKPVSLVSFSQTSNRDGTVNTNVRFLLRSRGHVPGVATLAFANCKILGACEKKTVRFQFNFRDPNAVYAASFEPVSSFTDGRVPLSLFVENLPFSITVADILVELSSNVTVTAIARKALSGPESKNARLDCIIPSSMSSQSLTPSIQIPKLGWILPFPSKFAYKSAPNPVILSVLPISAPMLTSAMVLLQIQNFPGVAAASDIEVGFRWSDGTTASGTVRSFKRTNTLLPPFAVQDISIQIDTPFGIGAVREGVASLIVYHQQYRLRVSTFSGFNFIDTTGPAVSSMSTNAQTFGSKSVEVRQSMATEVTVSVQNAKVAVVSTQIDGRDISLLTSQHDVDSRSAKIVFIAPKAEILRNIHGLLMFARETDICTSACCASSSCSTTCNGKTACFQLEYFDDLAPKVVSMSGTVGTELGGTLVQLVIAKFPKVMATLGESSKVTALFQDRYPGRVFVTYSTAEETALEIETPQIDMEGNVVKTVDLVLTPLDRPDREMRFQYQVNEVVPKIISTFPSQGGSQGGVQVRVRIEFFPFGEDAGVEFGELTLATDQVQTSSKSTKQRSEILFTTPTTGIGLTTVRIYPKSCPNCGKTVSMTFDQLDTSVPVLEQPIPVSGAMQEISGLFIFLKISNFPVNYETVELNFKGEGIDVAGTVLTVNVDPSQMASVLYVPPSSPRSGETILTITVNTLYQGRRSVKKVTTPYLFYDATALRTLSTVPASFPSRLSLFGQTLDFVQPTSLNLANFPQGIAFGQLSIVSGSTTIKIESIKDTKTCSPSLIDCNRTEIIIQSPPQDFAGSADLTISVNGGALFTVTLPYFQPCDYGQFCSSLKRIAARQLLIQRPPTRSDCESSYCVDLKDVPEPRVMSVVPTEGPTSGGTDVRIDFQNFPAFVTSEVQVTVGEGGNTVYGKVQSLQNIGGTLLRSEGYLIIKTPSVPNAVEVRTEVLNIQVSFGGLTRIIGINFMYTPVIIGNPIISKISRRGSVDASLFPTTSNNIIVQLTNFPFMKDLTSKSKIKAVFEGRIYDASSIMASSYASTVVDFTLEVQGAPGVTNISIYYDPFGAERAAAASLTVLAPPTPTVDGFFPLYGKAGRNLVLGITIKYLDHTLTEGDFLKITQVKMQAPGASTESDMSVTAVVVLTSATCERQECSKVTVNCELQGNLVPKAGGDVLVSLTFGKETVRLSVPFEADNTPELKNLDPKTMNVDKIETTVLKVYGSNMKPEFCSKLVNCSVSFDFSRFALVNRVRPGIVQHVHYDAGEHVFEVKVPQIGQAGMSRVTISSRGVSMVFDYEITMPDTDLLPIDSTCSGQETLVMKVRGWGSTIKFVSEIQVNIGAQVLQVQSIQSSVADRENIFSETIFSVLSPKSSRTGDLFGSVSLNGKISSGFRLECYEQPRAKLTPAEATLDGRTLSADGNSIEIFLENFPPIQTANDISVQFGNTACDGSQCVVLGYRNGVRGTTVRVSVPSVTEIKNVPVKITYSGAVAPPAGGDPSKAYVRSTKIASADFQYFRPAPKVVFAGFCLQCNEGASCLKNGMCLDFEEPRQSAMAMTAKGRMTVIVDNFPPISFDRTTGQVNEPAQVLITFGSNFGVLTRVLFSDKTRSAFEVALESRVEKGTLTAQLQVYPDASNPTSFSAMFPVLFYDNIVTLGCDQSDQCEGKLLNGNPFVATVVKYAISPSLVEGVLVKFDELLAVSVESVDSTQERTLLKITPPSYDCSSCVTANGFAKVKLSLILRATNELIVSSYYTFWAPPKLADCRFDSVGVSLSLAFDQPTNRAGMDANRNCSLLLSQGTVMKLGIGPECIWTSDSLLTVGLGLEATIVPGDTLNVREGGQSNLKGINLISASSETSKTIGAPAVQVPPYVELKAKDVIDPCSSLEIRATVYSPRPALYTWGCENDEVLDSYLSTQTADTIYLAPGTPSMRILDKEYKVKLSVTDFMGSKSPVQYLSIFKKSASTPQIQFTPPFLTVTRNEDVEINGEAVFSNCPNEKVDMIFRWQQVLGPPVSTQYLMVSIPQLEIPKNTLEPGATYRFSLQASMTGAASQVMEGIFELKTVYQELKPMIANGTSVKVSSFSSFQLSAEGSYDPDCPIAGAADPDLKYSWRCYYFMQDIQVDCRDSSTNDKLLLSSSRDIQIRQGVLVAAPFPFMFELTLAKKGRSPVSRTISVKVVDQILPMVTLTYEGGMLTPDGLVSLNLEDRLIIRGFCDDPKNVRYRWGVTPFVNLSDPLVFPLGHTTVNLVLQPNPEVFSPGNKYVISFGAVTRDGATSESQMTILFNSPPTGGTFSVCLLNLGDATSCIKTGVAVTDEFRVSSSGWADSNVPLLYKYGYETEPDPVTGGNVTTLWFDPVKDNTRDMGFPRGSLTVMAYIIDSLGGRTSMLKDSIRVVDSMSPQAGRRLLSAMSFLDKAKAKLKESLSAFRADKVNQMAGSMSSMGAGADMGGDIMNALVSGTDRAARSNGRACEAMGSAAAVSSKPANVGAGTVGGMAGMLKAMMKTKLGAMSGACAGSAASAISGSLKAQAQHKRDNPNNPSMLTPGGASDFVNSMEAGMQDVVRKTALDLVDGEPPKRVTSEGSELVISRAASTTLNGALMSQPLPPLFGSNSQRRSKKQVASIKLPDTFSADVFGTRESTLVDISIAAYGYAPDMPGWVLKSPMVGLTVSRAQASAETKVYNLSKPISIVIPVDLSGLNDVQKMLFPQQARCVFWDKNISTYNTSGCNVTAASTTEVTCECNHLTLFAISVDRSAGACGDGVIQPNEQCDDRNLYNRDGCSSKCVIEELCECKGEPSICFCRRKKGAGTPNADGVRATVALTGFKNIDDWLDTEIFFKETVAELVGEGVSKLDIVTIKVCHGGECEVFWEQGSYRRDLLPGGMLEEATGSSFLRSQSIHARHLLTTKTTDVTFQANVPPDSQATNAKIYAAIAFPSFLSRFSILYGSKVGREVSATFLVSPGLVTEQTGEIWNKPGANYTSDAAKPNQTDAVAFLNSFKEQTPLTSGVIFGIALSALFSVVLGLVYFVVIPRYKRSIEKCERAKVDADNPHAKKRAIHPSVDIPGALGLKKPQETDGGGGDDDDEGDDGVAGAGHQKRRPPRILDHGHHLQKHVHGVIDNNSGDSDDSYDDLDELPGGATENAKFGYAKRRLQQLQDQLDSILTEESDGARAPDSKPFEPSTSLTDSQTGSHAPRQSSRLPPLILGMGGGKAQTLVTSSANFEVQTLVRAGAAGSSGTGGMIGHTQRAAMDAGWGHPSEDKEIVKGADGRRMRPAAQAPEFRLQPVPPQARRPPQVNDAGLQPAPPASAPSRPPVGMAIRARPLLNDPG
jgi:cysteine-rich repeat protein